MSVGFARLIDEIFRRNDVDERPSDDHPIVGRRKEPIEEERVARGWRHHCDCCRGRERPACARGRFACDRPHGGDHQPCRRDAEKRHDGKNVPREDRITPAGERVVRNWERQHHRGLSKAHGDEHEHAGDARDEDGPSDRCRQDRVRVIPPTTTDDRPMSVKKCLLRRAHVADEPRPVDQDVRRRPKEADAQTAGKCESRQSASLVRMLNDEPLFGDALSQRHHEGNADAEAVVLGRRREAARKSCRGGAPEVALLTPSQDREHGEHHERRHGHVGDAEM